MTLACPVTTDPAQHLASQPLEAQLVSEVHGMSTWAGGLAYVDHGDWAVIRGVDFGASSVGKIFATRMATPYGGNQLEIRLDCLTGPIVASLTTQATGANFSNYETVYVPLVGNPQGVHDVYIVANGATNRQLCEACWSHNAGCDSAQTTGCGFGVGNFHWLHLASDCPNETPFLNGDACAASCPDCVAGNLCVACAEDSDGDGLSNAVEVGLGTNPLNPDSDGNGILDGADDLDGDGLSNLAETANGTALVDTDGDGVPDALDADDDGDGIVTAIEIADASALGNNDVDGDGVLNWHDLDSDGDGLLDADEGRGDSNGNGVPNYLDASPPAVATCPTSALVGQDVGVPPGAPRAGSQAAEADLITVIGSANLQTITFEDLTAGVVSGVVPVAPDVTLTVVPLLLPAGVQTRITQSTIDIEDTHHGYNVTPGGSKAMRFTPIGASFGTTLTFNFATPVTAFGLHVTGIDAQGGVTLDGAQSFHPAGELSTFIGRVFATPTTQVVVELQSGAHNANGLASGVAMTIDDVVFAHALACSL